jgi:hypothetical protein
MDLGLRLHMASIKIVKIYWVTGFLASQLPNKVYELCKSYSIVFLWGEGDVCEQNELDVKGFGRKVSYIIPLRLCDTGDGEGVHET